MVSQPANIVSPWIRESSWVPVSDVIGQAASQYERLASWKREVRTKADQIKRNLSLRQVPISLEERRGDLCIRAGGIAGLLVLGGLSIQVVPKFITDGASLLAWQDTVTTILARVRRRLFTYSPVTKIGLRSASFIDHVALAYTDALERASRQEAIHTYRMREETAVFLRGHLLVERQIQSVINRPHQIQIELDYLDTDNQYNRLLHWAGRRFLSLVLDTGVRRQLSLTLSRLPTVTEPPMLPMQLPVLPPPQYEHYAEAIEIASIIARGYGHGRPPGRYSGYGYLLNMERLYEAYIEESLRQAISLLGEGKYVQPQVTRLYAQAVGHNGKSYYSRPDNVVYDSAGQAVLLVDAKYKRLVEADEGTAARPNNSDMYQLFAAQVSHECERGLLIYPKVLGDYEPGDGIVRYWEFRGAGRPFLAGAVAVDISNLPSKAHLQAFDIQVSKLVSEVLEADVGGSSFN